MKKVKAKSGSGKAIESEKLFMVLAESGMSQDVMEVGYEGSPSTTNHYMVDADGLHLKLAKSPPRLA